jgi:MFS family permease
VTVAYSVITGVGFGLMYLPAIVATANHFTRQRSLAIAFCLCGAGFGTFTLSPLETYITAEYGWRWGFLSLAGLALLCVFAGSTMAPVERWLCPSPPAAPQAPLPRRPLPPA